MSSIDAISQQDPVFWQELQCLLDLLKKNQNQILDGHNNSLRKIEALIICQTGDLDDDKNFQPFQNKPDIVSNDSVKSLYSWVTPFYGDMQCKNFLYIYNSQVSLTTYSVGVTLSRDEARILKNLGLLYQVRFDNKVERNLVLKLT